ncbi:hypothetical protein D3C71_889710 [compost metagenome]
MAVEAVGAEHPQVVEARVVEHRVPGVVQRLAGLDHVAARQAFQVELVVHVEHGGGLAGVGEQQPHLAAGGVVARAHVQLVGQGARGARAGGLARQLRRGGHRDLRLGFLRRALVVRLRATRAAGQRRQHFVVGRGEVEGARQVTAHRATERRDVRLLHAEAGLDEADHRGVVEGLRVHPAAAAPGRDHVHRHAHAGAVDAAVGRGLFGGARRLGMREALEGDVGLGQRRLAGGRAVGVERGRGGRGVVVEVAVVLVEVDEQHGLAPHLGHSGEGIERFLDVPAAFHRARRSGVLRVGGGRDDPRHLRQLAVLHVVAEGVQVLVHVGAGHRVGDALVQRVAGVVAGRVVGRHRAGVLDRLARGLAGLAVLLETDQRVVAEVVAHVFIHDPADAGGLQALGEGLPLVAGGRGRRVAVVPLVGDRGHVRTRGAVGAGPVEHAVRVGARVHAAVVAVAQREGVGQRELVGQLGLLKVAHGLGVRRGAGLLVPDPLVGAAAVPGVLAVVPVVRRAGDALCVALGLVQVVGQHGRTRFVGLLPDVATARQRNGEAVAETTHAHERAEVVVERTVLLHQDDDVLDVLDGAGLVVGGNGQRAADARREGREGEGGRAGGGGAREEFAA